MPCRLSAVCHLSAMCHASAVHQVSAVCEVCISIAGQSQAVTGVQATPLERTERHRLTPTMQRAARSLFSYCPRVLAAWASTCTLQTLSSCMTVTGTPRWICRCCCIPLHCLLACLSIPSRLCSWVLPPCLLLQAFVAHIMLLAVFTQGTMLCCIYTSAETST